MASTTVRVSAETHELLRKLAAATGQRPVLIVSADPINQGPADLVRSAACPRPRCALAEDSLRLLLQLWVIRSE